MRKTSGYSVGDRAGFVLIIFQQFSQRICSNMNLEAEFMLHRKLIKALASPQQSVAFRPVPRTHRPNVGFRPHIVSRVGCDVVAPCL